MPSTTEKINPQPFQRVAAHMLKKHYGLELGDTQLTEDSVVIAVLEAGLRPYEVIAEHAEEAGLDRTDLGWTFGVHARVGMTAEDEVKALCDLDGVQVLCEQPTTCTKCGTRTHFDELASGQQLHRCIDTACGHQFIAEDEAEDAIHT